MGARDVVGERRESRQGQRCLRLTLQWDQGASRFAPEAICCKGWFHRPEDCGLWVCGKAREVGRSQPRASFISGVVQGSAVSDLSQGPDHVTSTLPAVTRSDKAPRLVSSRRDPDRNSPSPIPALPPSTAVSQGQIVAEFVVQLLLHQPNEHKSSPLLSCPPPIRLRSSCFPKENCEGRWGFVWCWPSSGSEPRDPFIVSFSKQSVFGHSSGVTWRVAVQWTLNHSRAPAVFPVFFSSQKGLGAVLS